jgi:putative peptidoglycan lipid II flippase
MDRRRDAARDAWEQRQGSPQGPSQGYPPQNNAAWPGDPYRTAAAGDQEVNPPWESESLRYPVPAREEHPSQGLSWEWSAVEETYPGVSMDDMTGTGKVPVVTLQPSDSAWSAGVRAPKRPTTEKAPATAVGGIVASARGVAVPGVPVEAVEVDDQPSSAMRAMRAGNLAKATAIVSAALLLSRLLGLFRTTLFTYTFGFSMQADAFTNAFVFPEIIFNIVAGGALASAFIPVFTGYLIEKKDRRTAWHVASSALNLSIAALTILAIVGFIFTPQFLNLLLHPLFARPDQSEADLVVNLTRIMLLQPIFLGAATVAVAILQARQSFVLPAIAQVLYTASLIVGILATIADNRWGIFGRHLGIYGPALGVVLGAALQLIIQIPGLRGAKMRYRPTFDVFHPGVRHMFRLMVPRLLNAAMLYLSVVINRSLLTLLNDNGAVYGYVTAFTLVMLPIGVFGMAVSQASFPSLATFVATGEWTRLRDTIMRTLRGVTYLALPSALGLIVLAQPLTQFLLGHGEVDLSKLYLIWQPLIFFSLGLLGLSLVEILVRSFYALHDTRTAVEVSILQFMFVIGLSILLLDPMGSNGLALATALGSTGEAVVLLLLLRPRVGGLDLRGYGAFFLNALGASVVAALAALAVYLAGGLILPVSSTEASLTTTVNLGIRLTAAILVALGAFYGASRFLGIDDTVPIDRIFRRLLRRG